MSRPVLPWRSPLCFVPPLNKLVWVRRLPWYDRPVRAASNGYAGAIVEVPLAQPDPYSETLELIWSDIHTWKFQFLADELAAFPPE
jgi:hypothetical protein